MEAGEEMLGWEWNIFIFDSDGTVIRFATPLNDKKKQDMSFGSLRFIFGKHTVRLKQHSWNRGVYCLLIAV